MEAGGAGGGDAADANVAVTAAFAVNGKLHELAPLQAPDHPENVEVALGVAVSVTIVALEKLALQVCPQLIPAGALVMVPDPAPAL